MKHIGRNIIRIPTALLPVGYLQCMEELSLGLLKANPASGRKGDLNRGPPD